MGRHNATTPYRPVRALVWAAVLLAGVSGILVAAIGEAIAAGDTIWIWAFGCFLVSCFLIYVWIITGLIAFAVNKPVYAAVDGLVDLRDGSNRNDHHPGDN